MSSMMRASCPRSLSNLQHWKEQKYLFMEEENLQRSLQASLAFNKNWWMEEE